MKYLRKCLQIEQQEQQLDVEIKDDYTKIIDDI